MPKIIIVSGPVIIENNKVLLNLSGEDNFWKFCGGRINDFNSSLIETAHREAKEEMGIDLEILDKTPFIMYILKIKSDEMIDVILVHYLAKRIGEITAAKDIREWKWFDINNLPDNSAPNIEPALKYFRPKF